ncbi:MAG: GntR family transcriptional regulator [Verrucomicrobiales bacterium]|nr:GntR family transcriptional regulator [Verrucomicrobiales bacterium]
MATHSLSEKAYLHIRERVFSGEFAPGSQLVNRTLAAEVGTSFIPVREAISRLASEGIVEQVAGAGAFVKQFDRQEISEIYDVRELFEPFAAGEAARLITTHELSELKSILSDWESLETRIAKKKRGANEGDLDQWLAFNERFHEIVITASRNRILSRFTSGMQVLSQCFAAHRGSPKLLSPELIRRTIDSHRSLYEALENRKSEVAAAIVREQLEQGRLAILQFFDQARSNSSK